MTTLLPTDADDNPIPAVRLKAGGAHTIATSGVSARNAIAFDSETRIVSLYASEDVYVKFGDAGVSATSADHFFPKGVYYDFAVGGDRTPHYTHVAVLQVTTGGNFYVSEKE